MASKGEALHGHCDGDCAECGPKQRVLQRGPASLVGEEGKEGYAKECFNCVAGRHSESVDVRDVFRSDKIGVYVGGGGNSCVRERSRSRLSNDVFECGCEDGSDSPGCEKVSGEERVLRVDGDPCECSDEEYVRGESACEESGCEKRRVECINEVHVERDVLPSKRQVT